MTGATGPGGSPGSRPARSERAASSPAGVVLRLGLVGLITVVLVVVFGVRVRVRIGVRLGGIPVRPVAFEGRQLRRDRRERLGERVGEVTEDVGRVVVLDELL